MRFKIGYLLLIWLVPIAIWHIIIYLKKIFKNVVLKIFYLAPACGVRDLCRTCLASSEPVSSQKIGSKEE